MSLHYLLTAAYYHYAYNSLFLSPTPSYATPVRMIITPSAFARHTNCTPRGLGRPRDRTRAHLHEMSSGLSGCSFESTTPKLFLRLS